MNQNRGFYCKLISSILLAPIAMAQSDLADSQNWPLKPYHGNRDQFTLEIPDNWHVVDQSPYRANGVIAFYSQALVIQPESDPAIQAEQNEKFMALMNDMMSGAAPSFFMDRYKAEKGMTCAGFSEQAQKKKIKILTSLNMFGKGAKIVGQPAVSKIEFAGCQGLKVRLRANVPGEESKEMLVFSAAVDDITYDIALLTDAQYFEQNLPWFERVAATMRLTGAQ